jgi:hypothetical protein
MTLMWSIKPFMWNIQKRHSSILRVHLNEHFNELKGHLFILVHLLNGHLLYKMPSEGFLFRKSYLKELETQKEFLEDLMFFMIKGYMALRTIKSIWLHYLHTCCVLGLSFHFRKSLWKKLYFPWCWKHYKPCVTYFKWMSFNHLHLWPSDVKSCTWYVHHCARFFVQ